ncbi:MAG: hypothetical protein Q8K59_05675 [Nitrosomonas sp.]|nr:hypothetical protein [Nitrosomonas sp.]
MDQKLYSYFIKVMTAVAGLKKEKWQIQFKTLVYFTGSRQLIHRKTNSGLEPRPSGRYEG